MATINMSLDDIIQANKDIKKLSGNRSGGAKKPQRRSGGSRRNNINPNFAFTENVPEGQWKHDMFQEKEENNSTNIVRIGGGNPNAIVTINVSNLDKEKVQANDLEDLFNEYAIDSAVVHFDAQGNSLGTGAIVCSRTVAQELIKEFQNVRLDGRLLKLAIVGDSAGGIRDRLKFDNSNGDEKKYNRLKKGGIRKNRPGSDRHPLDRVDSGDEGKSRGNRGGRGGRGGDRNKYPKSIEELDAELEKYMNKGSSKAMEE